MSDYPWVIDESVEVVHHHYCSLIMGHAVPYGSAAQTNDEMIEALNRPDVSNNHTGTSPLVPCDQCILGLELDG